ncbi:RNA-directed DNA polymerase, eukaryota [Tanacetum coccineum]
MMAGHLHTGFKSRRAGSSNEDLTQKISHSNFVTNFPDSVNSQDLWNKCRVYGTVVDVFIPAKLSKAGKRFAFVRFIKVYNLDRLVENLCTLWIGSHHLFANHVRFDRPPKHLVKKADFPPLNGAYKSNGTGNKQFESQKDKGSAGSFVSVVNGVANPLISSSPALVLDDGCIIERDFSKSAIGRVKDLNCIPNLKIILADEGFEEIKVYYLGGRWVMFECNKIEAKKNLMKHTGICSWFHVIQDVSQDFVSDERVVWVDIEGIPLHAWKRDTFLKIGKKWGETLDIEESADTSFGRKRLCIITKHPSSILETFKVIVKGRVFMVRAKELFMWNPSFLAVKEQVYVSDNDSVRGKKINEMQFHSSDEEEEEGEFVASEVEEVAETVFEDNSDASKKHKHNTDDQQSADPFEIYKLLNRNKTEVEMRDSSQSLPHPPGFTPLVSEVEKFRNQPSRENGDSMNKESSSEISVKVMNKSQDVQEEVFLIIICVKYKAKVGGSVLEYLRGRVSDSMLLRRNDLKCQLHDIKYIGGYGLNAKV